MPWKEVLQMDEKLRFVSLMQSDDWTIKELCEEFGVSRKTGYKWINRYHQYGIKGLGDRSRSPVRQPGRTSMEVERKLVAIKRKHRTWGPKKIQEVLRGQVGKKELPCRSTIARIMKRLGLVRSRRQRARSGNQGFHGPLTEARRANHVWCVDYKGWFLLGDGNRCDPLTVSDLFSRYIIGIKVVKQATQQHTKNAFKRMFRLYGLPEIIRVDNGSPFASLGPAGLSQLSVWWISLGIKVEYTRPGKPQDNGSHERMHKTLKAESCTPPAPNSRAQQLRFNRWRKIFNKDRPHESLQMRKPAEKYRDNPRRFTEKIKIPTVRPGDKCLEVDNAGYIRWKEKDWYLGLSIAGKTVALRKGPRPDWPSVWYGGIELGVLGDSPSHWLQRSASARKKAKELKEKESL